MSVREGRMNGILEEARGLSIGLKDVPACSRSHTAYTEPSGCSKLFEPRIAPISSANKSRLYSTWLLPQALAGRSLQDRIGPAMPL
eukprot:2589736-Pyramimonas_sp.AAC.1